MKGVDSLDSTVQIERYSKAINCLSVIKAILHELLRIALMLLMPFMALFALDGWKTECANEHMSLIQGLTKIMPGMLWCSAIVALTVVLIEFMAKPFAIKMVFELLTLFPIYLFISLGYFLAAESNKLLMNIGVISIAAIYALFVAYCFLPLCIVAIRNQAELKEFWIWLCRLIRKRGKE
jgi:hypothetical protein